METELTYRSRSKEFDIGPELFTIHLDYVNRTGLGCWPHILWTRLKKYK